MPRSAMHSKYCALFRPGAFASAKAYFMLMPSIGCCVTPSTSVGGSMPITS